MNNTVPINLSASHHDYFEKLFTSDLLKVANIATFFVASITGLLLLGGIIWYEKNGRFRYRTVVNQLFSTFAWTLVWGILLIYIPVGIRHMTGPLSETFCYIFAPLRYFLLNCVLLTFNAITLVRYIFIFKMRNFAVINDDFVTRCLVLSILVMSGWSTIVTELSPGEPRFQYFICAGMDPNQNKGDTYYQNQPREVQTMPLIILGSVILHIIVNTNIYFYERAEKQNNAPIQLGTLNHENGDTKVDKTVQQTISTGNKSLVDFATQILFLVHIMVVGTIELISNVLELSIFNDDKYAGLLLFYKVVGPYGPVPPILTLMIGLAYYWRNDSLRDFLFRKTNNLLKKE